MADTDEPDVDPTETDDSPEETDVPETDKDEPEKDEFDADRAKAKIRKANSEAQRLRARLKELEPLAAKAKELEDANKSETEKLIEDRDASKSRADSAEMRATKFSIALEHAPESATVKQIQSVAKRLSGSTEEELEADAVELYEMFGASAKKPQQRKPTEKLRGGSDPDEPIEETDPRKLADLIRGK